MDLWGIFVTGFTTGGLSCMAVQGGVLASAIANQKDAELKRTGEQNPAVIDQLDWMPVVMFLSGKLVSYAVLGLFLGFLGSQLTISPSVQLLFQGVAVLFMFATAMNLLNAHPVFRYVLIQPPKMFTRLVRSQSRSKAIFTPLVLGILTLLIPCGVTQSMEVLAVSSGSAVTGMLIMTAFVTGTMPVFAALGLGVAKISEAWHKAFETVAAFILILLTLSGFNAILTALDAPVTAQKLPYLIAGVSQTSQGPAGDVAIRNGVQEVYIRVLPRGYSPDYIRVKAGIPVRLTLETNGTYSCAGDFVFPEFGLHARMGPTDTEVLEFTPKEKGRFTYACSMGMYSGIMEVY